MLQELVKRDIKVRYKRSVLGIFWTMLNPLLMMIIMTIVFASLFRQTITNFPIYVLSGYIVWSFFAQSTMSASTSMLDSSGLTRKVYLPPALLPWRASSRAGEPAPLAHSVGRDHGRDRRHVYPSAADAAVLLLLLALFAYGLGLVLAASSVFFRDTVYTYGSYSWPGCI